jgi:hypothetical protein
LEALAAEMAGVNGFNLHAPDRDTSFKEILRELSRLHEEGRFKRSGVPNYLAWEAGLSFSKQPRKSANTRPAERLSGRLQHYRTNEALFRTLVDVDDLANYLGCHGRSKGVEPLWSMVMVRGSIGVSSKSADVPMSAPQIVAAISPDKCPRTTPPNKPRTHTALPQTPDAFPRKPCTYPALFAPLEPARPAARPPQCRTGTYTPLHAQQLPVRARCSHAPRFSRPGAQNDLFSSYNRSASPSKDKKKPRSPYAASPYSGTGAPSYAFPSSSPAPESPSFGAYPGANGVSGSGSGTFRSATPNSRGQYSAATLDELESQNDDQAGVLIGKVKMLKDVRSVSCSLSTSVYTVKGC